MMDHKFAIKSGVILAFYLLSSPLVQAQSVLRDQLSVEKSRKWGVSAEVGGSSSFQSLDSQDHVADSYLTISPSYQISPKLKVLARAGVVKELTQQQDSSLTNTRISLSTSPIALNPDISWIPTGNLYLPTNEREHKDTTYNGSIGFRPTFIFNIKKYTLTSLTNLQKNFHTYDRSRGNTANIDFQLSQTLALDIPLYKTLGLSLSGAYTEAWTYQASRRELFSLSEELNYSFDNKTSVGLGHSNGGSVFASNGRDNNIEFFNGRTSQIYVYLSSRY